MATARPTARTHATALVGVEGILVEVETAITRGLPGLHLVGLADHSALGARDRGRAGMYNSGFEWPNRQVTVTLAPCGLPKRGAVFDLAIAVSMLAAMGAVPPRACAEPVFIGELGCSPPLKMRM